MKPISIKLVIVSLLAAARLVYAGATAETGTASKPALAVWSKTSSPPHWAFIGLNAFRCEAPRRDLGPHSVDAFIRARLEKENLRPSPRQITGPHPPLKFRSARLPPRIEESGVSRRSTSRGLRVDHFLASPHFGERWGRHWLDLRATRTATVTKDTVRLRISLSRLGDRRRQSRPPIRPILDRATRRRPHPERDRGSKIATGFHRNTLTNKEGGVDQKNSAARPVDRSGTTGTVWLGLTVGCAECHSHKYDPISQREFYQLYAFFKQRLGKRSPCAASRGTGDLPEQDGAGWLTPASKRNCRRIWRAASRPVNSPGNKA